MSGFSGGGGGGFTLVGVQATTSGASVDFSIPAGAKFIAASIYGVSTTAGRLTALLGDAGGIETTGYITSSIGIIGSGQSLRTNTAHFEIDEQANSTSINYGEMFLTLVDPAAFSWAASWTHGTNTGTAQVNTGGGTKALSAELTTLRFAPDSGNFDAGSINVGYM